MLQDVGHIWLAVGASLAAGLATALGALLLYVRHTYSDRVIATTLGFGAGVMLGAMFFALITPALAISGAAYPDSRMLPFLLVGLSLVLGAWFVSQVERLLPHEHMIKGHEGGDGISVRGAWLFVIAIAVHNLPEGIAVGVSFGGNDLSNGLAVSSAIALHNIPEGITAGIGLLAAGYSMRTAVGVSALMGGVETLGGLVGVVAVTAVAPLLPYALAFAGGTMLYVTSHEVIPESHRPPYSRWGTWGVIAGFLLMMALNEIF